MINSLNNIFFKNITFLLLSIISLLILLKIGENIIIPFIMAIFITLMLLGISSLLWKIKIFNIYLIPNIFKLPLSVIIFITLLIIWWDIINNNIQLIILKIPQYQSLIIMKFNIILTYLHLKEVITFNWIIENINLQWIVKNTINNVMWLFKSIGIIIFYTIFLLLEYKYLETKIDKIINNNRKKKFFYKVYNNIKSNLSSYFIIKTSISFITWILSYIVMSLYNLDFAIFWALIIFLLNYIPSVWSIIAILFPITLSLIQFDSLIPFIILSWLLIGIQIFMWNIVEPKFMWNRLNLSPLIIILALSFWWTLWWVLWMILAVPLTIIINITFSQIPSTQKISILLSEKWIIKI